MLPLTLFSTIWLKCVNMMGIKFINNEIFMKVGLFPLNDHYYNPLINPKKNLKKSLRKDRNLKGIDFNVDEQLDLLGKFNFQDKLLQFPINQINENEFYYNNGGFESGDSEYLYSIIRYFKPKKLLKLAVVIQL